MKYDESKEESYLIQFSAIFEITAKSEEEAIELARKELDVDSMDVRVNEDVY